MADRISQQRRSENMAAIRAKDTKPELIVRKYLHSRGFRYRLNVKELPGKPDIVLAKYRTAIFVNGCFWHFHGCRNSVIPKTNSQWWEQKLLKNRERDQLAAESLSKLDWQVVTLWECELNGRCLSVLTENLRERTKMTQPRIDGGDNHQSSATAKIAN